MKNKFLLINFIILFLIFNTNIFASNKPGGNGEFELWGDGMHNKFKGTWKVYSLMGEPVKVLHVKWMATTSINYENEVYTSTSLVCEQYLPQGVINKVKVIDFKIRGNVSLKGTGYDLSLNFTPVLVISGDVLAQSGFEKYGKNNLTVPASPEWDDLFISNLYTGLNLDIPFLTVDEQGAKSIMKRGFTLYDIKIQSIKYNYLPVRAWLSKNKDRCEKEEEKTPPIQPDFIDERDQLVNEDKEASFLDDIANLWDEFKAEETDFERALVGKESTGDHLGFESQLAGIDDYPEDLAAQKAEANRKEQIRLQKERELEEKRQQEMAAQDYLYEPFKSGDEEQILYGFKKSGAIVIKPEYDGITRFNNGVSRVCKIISDKKVKFNFIEHNNQLVGSWRESEHMKGVNKEGEREKIDCFGVNESHENKITTYHFIKTYIPPYRKVSCHFRSVAITHHYKVSEYDIEGNFLMDYKKETSDSFTIGSICLSK